VRPSRLRRAREETSAGLNEEAAIVAAFVGDDAADPGEINSLIDDLRKDQEHASRLLEKLSSNEDVDVRLWVSKAAREVLGEAAIPLILRLTRDRDVDVQDVAIEELFQLGPLAARKVVALLRRKLKSKDIYQPVFAMWKLVELNDRESLPLIRAVADAPEGDYPFHQRTARVVCMLMETPYEIVERIRSHDHELMQWLTIAARELRTEEARAALEECARSAPDRECRRMCEGALASWDSPD
jgi:hypothetical protein